MPHTLILKTRSIPVPDKFLPGHVCTAGEAHALNKEALDRVRNILLRYPHWKSMSDQDIRDRVARFVFGAENKKQRKLSAVELLALKLAKTQGRMMEDCLEEARVELARREAEFSEVLEELSGAQAAAQSSPGSD